MNKHKSLVALAEALKAHSKQVIIEDGHGFRYRIVSCRTIGIKTDDPGIILEIECDP